MKEKFAFQTIATELYKQPKTKNRANKIISSLDWSRSGYQN